MYNIHTHSSPILDAGRTTLDNGKKSDRNQIEAAGKRLRIKVGITHM